MITVAAGILTQGGRVLICQRKRSGAFPLQWEFPGGKVESGEDVQTCLRRELHEELAIEADVGAEIMLDPVLNIWDCAAIQPILEEAGGTFTDWNGTPTHTGGNGFSTNGHLFQPVMDIIRSNR